ncbi:ribonuclease [Salipaludibacillus keqinensis]|uniref:Ribonuclease n=1 Tax=Salipaludibacillus keqinensis TaxID=2045207 RepID=A0A323THS4_9BACI|nr:YlzJ-like family protein [Salipaludibacillus keqinensis]PYZ93087.1 ribonuclease [Salipaludibacillus keqinensis]
MILYTYQQIDSIFPVEESDYQAQQVVDIPGGQLMLEQVSDEYRIVRLLSTDPNLFLDPRYTPGQPYKPSK